MKGIGEDPGAKMDTFETALESCTHLVTQLSAQLKSARCSQGALSTSLAIAGQKVMTLSNKDPKNPKILQDFYGFRGPANTLATTLQTLLKGYPEQDLHLGGH
jgi:hypothetical protein